MSAEFDAAYDRFKQSYEIAYASIMKFGGPAEAAKYPDAIKALTSAFYTFVYARDLAPFIVNDKVVPQKKAKAFDKAFRASNGGRPRNSGMWFIKNLPSLQLMLESASWPDKGASLERTQSVGTLQLHNQTRIADISANTKLLQAAYDLMVNSGIPDIQSALYGDVNLVGDIERKKNIAAKYYKAKDTIFVILVKRFDDFFLQSVIHEFGHRYYQKVYTQTQRDRWHAHHVSIRRSVGAPRMPDVGDMVALGPDRSEAVVGYQTDHRSKIFILMEGGGRINTDNYIKVIRENSLHAAYPTVYASTDPEEHFCEAFALFCLGELAEPHRTNFEALVVNQRATNPAHQAIAWRLAHGQC